MYNPNAIIAKSKGIDLPIMYWYLAGYMSGEKLNQCMSWRKKIRNHFKEYEYDEEVQQMVSYPFAFLDPFNGKEHESIDAKGLTSSISPNAIFDGDYLSVKRADGLIVNVDDFFDTNLRQQQTFKDCTDMLGYITYLHSIINGHRPMIGTWCEFAWALELRKPIVLLVPESKRSTYEKHPFAKRASDIVTSVDELFEKKILETFYRRIAGAIY